MAAGQQRARRLPSAGREAGAALLFLEDIRVATLLLNAARYRALDRWLGLNKTQANLLTLVALATVADAAQRQTARVMAPGPPGAADFALSTAAAESALRMIAGQTTFGAAPGTALVTVAIVYKLVGPASRRALRSAGRSPLRLRKAVMAQAQRLADAAATAAAAARDAATTSESDTTAEATT